MPACIFRKMSYLFRKNAPMTTEGQKVVVKDRAALEAIAQAIKLPRKCFVVFSPKEHSIQEIGLDDFLCLNKFLINS